jgi:glycosyltransferase involved in cell wall biosynthesis
MAPRKIRVLYIDGSIGFGGAPKSLALLLSGLTSVEPIIVTSARDDVRAKWFRGYRVYRIGMISSYYRRRRATEWVAAHVRNRLLQRLILKGLLVLDIVERVVCALQILVLAKFHRVQLVHMNTACFPPEGLYVARFLRIPSISHLRGFFTYKESIFVNAMRRASIVIGISRAVAESIYHIKDPRFVRVVYNPVDSQAFQCVVDQQKEARQSLGLRETDIGVGIFGRVVHWKGQREFVYACIEAMRKNPDIKAVIIGDASDSASAYFNEIKAIISGSEFRERFVLAGYREDVERLYVAMDIIVHASVEPEPLGRVVLEGMAAKKPVIATDAGGPSEVIESGSDGILVPIGDIQRMGAAILELANDPRQRERMGNSGYNKVKTQFAIEPYASEVQRIYDELLHNAV